jgi:hypothetical protein
MEQTFSEHLLSERGRSHGNFVLAVIAGLATGSFGAGIWMGVSLLTGWHAVPLALGIGLLVGWAVRASGQGSHFIYGALGVMFTLLTCLVGELGVAIVSATNSSLDLYGALTHIHIDAMIVAIIGQISPTEGVLYAVSAFMAYKISIVK